ncbi:hypothetical protein [Thiocystis violacea]|uniref:hypothetical protein n=1 Tax=Thiocystis violacea TaxID=13725 RepID=UPI00190892AF|nr:hypothetical protein [Thiocystis violacea]
MTHLLHIDTSLFSHDGVSSTLPRDYVAHRDLGRGEAERQESLAVATQSIRQLAAA